MSEPKYPLKTNGNNISNAIDFISGISDGYKAALELSNHFTKRASDSSSQSKEKLKTGKGYSIFPKRKTMGNYSPPNYCFNIVKK